MVSFDPKVNKDLFKIAGANPFAPQKVAFTGGGQEPSSDGYSSRLSVGKAAGTDSNGVIGSVTGTGANGASQADGIAKKWGLGDHLYG